MVLIPKKRETKDLKDLLVLVGGLYKLPVEVLANKLKKSLGKFGSTS